MKREVVSFRSNAKLARELWGLDHRPTFRQLRELTIRHSLSIAAGDLLLLNGRLYITHSGLLRIALRRGCRGIETLLQENQSDASAGRWVFKATVFKNASSKSFVGFGDANPTNTSPLVRGSEMRVAETRAVNRALRKAYGIGLCSVEELGAVSESSPNRLDPSERNGSCSSNGNHRHQPSLRDRLCLLIRQFKLDPTQVKNYAAQFCGTKAISEASRESIEEFISHLKKMAEENREELICKLNSYGRHMEVGS